MILSQISEVSSFHQIRQNLDLTVENVEMIFGSEHTDCERTLYICPADIAGELLKKHNSDRPLMLIICGTDVQPDDFEFRKNISYIITGEDVSSTGNRLIRFILGYNKWCDDVQQIIYRDKSISKILNLIIDRTGGAVLWLNSGYRLLAESGSGQLENVYLNEIHDKGYLSEHSIASLLALKGSVPLFTREHVSAYGVSFASGQYGIITEIKKRYAFSRYFVLISDAPHKNHGLIDELKAASSLLCQFAAVENTSSFETNEGISDLLQDLIEENISGDAELSERVSRFPEVVSRWYQCVVVSSGKAYDENQRSLLMIGLHKIFENCMTCYYEDNIILFIRKTNIQPLSYDDRKLEDLMHQHNSCACIGNHTAFLSSFRTLYLSTKMSLNMGMKLKHEGERRILIGEHYLLYQIIDICANHGDYVHGGNLMFLCSPRYLELRKHDLKNNDSLSNIFMVYVQNNCNSSQAAKKLFLHRNTLLNKIAKIEEIVGGSLDNHELRTDLYFSALVIDYCRIFRNINPVEDKLMRGRKS